MTREEEKMIKSKLVKSRLWSKYASICKEMRSNGNLPADRIREDALLKVAPEMFVEYGIKAVSDIEAEKAKIKEQNGDDGVGAESKKRVVNKVIDENGILTVDKSVFKGKDCKLSESFAWAYSHVCVRGIKPSDAPSSMAWQLLNDMKSSVSVRMSLLKLGIDEIKVDSGKEGDKSFDGIEEYDILGKMRSILSESEEIGDEVLK